MEGEDREVFTLETMNPGLEEHSGLRNYFAGEDVRSEQQQQNEEEEELSVEELVAIANTASQVKRPLEVVNFLHKAGKSLYATSPNVEFTIANLELLASGLKLLINPLRNAVRTLSETLARQQAVSKKQSIQEIDTGDTSNNGIRGDDTSALLREYRAAKSNELADKCLEVISVVCDTFLPLACRAETRVFLNKLAGDHARYISEIPQNNPDRKDVEMHEWAIAQAQGFYLAAMEEAQSDLAPTHPLRLSLNLNTAIFYFEIKADRERAREIAQNAFDDAVAELGVEPDQSYKITKPGPEAANCNEDREGLSEVSSLVANQSEDQAAAQEASRVLKIIESSLDRWATL